LEEFYIYEITLKLTWEARKISSLSVYPTYLLIKLRPAAAFLKMDEPGQLKSITQGFLEYSHRPVKPLACPARFERATYALEAVKMS
jgi:hypothetical protein